MILPINKKNVVYGSTLVTFVALLLPSVDVTLPLHQFNAQVAMYTIHNPTNPRINPVLAISLLSIRPVE